MIILEHIKEKSNMIKLYHGTIYQIDKIDVSQGRNHKDFGKGFYIAQSSKQAIDIMHKKYRVYLSGRKKIPNAMERLYAIYLKSDILENLTVKKFETADFEWLDLVLKCRQSNSIPHNYDVVIGPTADDDTALCIKYYFSEVYGTVGSKEAKNKLLSELEVENLGIQYFIGKQGVADELIADIKLLDWRNLK